MRVLFLAGLLALSGCASLGPKFEKVQAASPDQAVVYVYRPSAFTGSARSPDIYLNGQKIGTAPNGSYFVADVAPGSAKIAQRNFAGEETGAFEVSLRAGQVYYLRIDLGIPTLKESLNAQGKSMGRTCPFQGLNITLRGNDGEILAAMDPRAQKSTCWPGFMLVNGDLAQKELPQTQLSK